MPHQREIWEALRDKISHNYITKKHDFALAAKHRSPTYSTTMQRHNLFVITGGNRGFGLAIAKALQAHEESKQLTTIVLVGRDTFSLEQASASLNGATLKCFCIGNAELDKIDTIDKLVIPGINKVVQAAQASNPITNAYLINNAGTTGDLSKKVSHYGSQEVKNYFDVNIVSYVSLVSGFIKLFREPQASDESPFPPDLTIVNISSLLAVQAFPNWGLYASGKAARDMFLKVVAAEEKDNHVKTLSYAPGPLDNEMQSQVRASLGDPEQKKIYSSMAEEGKLVKMEESANKLLALVFSNDYESGVHIDFYDC